MAVVSALELALNANSKQLSRELNKSKREFTKFATGVSKNLKTLAKTTATAAAGLATAFAIAAKKSIDQATIIERNAKSIGISVKSYETLSGVIRQVGLGGRRYSAICDTSFRVGRRSGPGSRILYRSIETDRFEL